MNSLKLLNVGAGTEDTTVTSDYNITGPTSSSPDYGYGCVEFSNGGVLISDRVRYLIEVSVSVVTTGTISVVGSIANIINIIVFCKQGFNDTINISLLGLAISDLGALLTLVLISVSQIPYIYGSRVFLGTCQLHYLTAGWPHTYFTRVGSWITAFITFERCLCIALPLQVKTIITKRRTTFVIVGIFTIYLACVSPVYYAIRIVPRFIRQYNRIMSVLMYIKNGPEIEVAVFNFNIASQLSTFIIVIVCTILLIHNLLLKSQWRRENASVSGSCSNDVMSSRDKRVAKLVTFISGIFIFCYSPSIVNWALMSSLTPEYSATGSHKNSFTVSWTILNMLEAVNSSVNIIVYFKMSSKYKSVLKSMFCPFRPSDEPDMKIDKIN